MVGVGVAVAGRAAVALLAGALLGGAAPTPAAPTPAAPPPAPAYAHPIHTSLTELAYDPTARTVNLLVRVFADDFSSAVLHARPAAPDAPIVVPPDSAIVRYLAGKLALADGSGRAIPLRWCGTRRAAEVLFLCLRAPTGGPPAGVRVRNALLTELFSDQVNIVQASVGRARQTLLFTPGDGAKALR